MKVWDTEHAKDHQDNADKMQTSSDGWVWPNIYIHKLLPHPQSLQKGFLKKQSTSSTVSSMGTPRKQLWYDFSVAEATNIVCPLSFGPFLVLF